MVLGIYSWYIYLYFTGCLLNFFQAVDAYKIVINVFNLFNIKLFLNNVSYTFIYPIKNLIIFK